MKTVPDTVFTAIALMVFTFSFNLGEGFEQLFDRTFVHHPTDIKQEIFEQMFEFLADLLYPQAMAKKSTPQTDQDPTATTIVERNFQVSPWKNYFQRAPTGAARESSKL